jgi:hypothetical protein
MMIKKKLDREGKVALTDIIIKSCKTKGFSPENPQTLVSHY